MALPWGTYVKHLDGNGLNCRCENLRLVRGIPDPEDRPDVVASATDDNGRIIFLHDLIMAGMIAEGHPNARLDESGNA